MGKGGEKMTLQSVGTGIDNGGKKQEHSLKKGLNGKLIFAIIASALGSSFQHGYNTGVTNNPEKVLLSWISEVMGNRTGIVPEEGSVTIVYALAVSIFCVGGMIGGVSTGFIANRFGRKKGLLLNNILVFIAAIFFGSAKAAASHELFILARLIIGVNSGLNAGLAPMYLAEISPINLRGAVGSVYQLVITISILVAQALGLKYALGTPEHWPVLFALTAVPAIFQILTLPFCPESPKYLLLSKGKEMEAQKALGWLRGSLQVHEELEQMKAENDAVKLLPKVTVRELLTNRVLRIPLIICLFVMVAQQLSGINAVIFFSTSIFQQSGLKDDSATFATMGMGAINVLMTIVSLVLVEKAGRKTLLLLGFGGMAIDTLLLTIAMNFTSIEPNLSYLCIVLVFIYIIMFASGPGSIPWFLVAELFNQSARPTAASLAVCTNWTANFLVGLAFLPIIKAIGPYVFIIFVALNALFFLFIYKKVPETKNKTVEEISALFKQQMYE
ncbi:hypothetical protein Zmor_013028 [Zophobas morio]|uniref:Major facilitator superfamily (MFS) profile domain-containing protein n=1 Tax=Zophobas morio TaxID=2755281 RepID=A0AA38ME82_9CUCU|nr:hypothetical protein Zmor_013028 [Zophobas morio]